MNWQSFGSREGFQELKTLRGVVQSAGAAFF